MTEKQIRVTFAAMIGLFRLQVPKSSREVLFLCRVRNYPAQITLVVTNFVLQIGYDLWAYALLKIIFENRTDWREFA